MNTVTREEMKKMSDYDLILYYQAGTKIEKNKAADILITRYNKLIEKHWSILKREVSGIYYAASCKDDFLSEAYLGFMKAADAINLDKIVDDNWKFLGYYNYLLCTARKTVRTNMIKKCSNLMSINSAEDSEDDRDSFNITNVVEKKNWESSLSFQDTEEIVLGSIEEEKLHKVIDSCYKDWSDMQRQVFDYLNEGYSKKEIAKKLNTKVANVYHASRTIREQIENRMAK